MNRRIKKKRANRLIGCSYTQTRRMQHCLKLLNNHFRRQELKMHVDNLGDLRKDYFIDACRKVYTVSVMFNQPMYVRFNGLIAFFRPSARTYITHDPCCCYDIHVPSKPPSTIRVYDYQGFVKNDKADIGSESDVNESTDEKEAPDACK